jgi:archaellum biogenesis ATPase FlaH
MAESEDLTTPKKVIPTGIKGIDDYCKHGDGVYGLTPGDVGLVGAPMAVGKTSLLTVMARNMAEQGFKVLNVVVEDTLTYVINKYYSMDTGIALSEIQNKMGEVIEKLKEVERDGNVYIKRLPPGGDLKECVRPVFEKYDIDVLVFDGLIASNNHLNPSSIFSTNMSKLREISDEFGVVIWGTPQTKFGFKNESIIEKFQRRTLHQATFVAHMDRKSLDYSSGEREIKIIKSRYNREVDSPENFTIHMDFNKLKLTE